MYVTHVHVWGQKRLDPQNWKYVSLNIFKPANHLSTFQMITLYNNSTHFPAVLALNKQLYFLTLQGLFCGVSIYIMASIF